VSTKKIPSRKEPSRPRTLVVGTSDLGNDDGSDRVDFYSKKNFSDYELVVVEPLGAISQLQAPLSGAVRFRFYADGVAFVERFKEATQRVMRFITDGGFCVMFLRKLPVVEYTGEFNTEGVDINTCMPFKLVTCTEAHGDNIEWTGDGPFRDFANLTKDCWQYSAYFHDDGKKRAVANVKGHLNQSVAGLFVAQTGGRLLLLPSPNESPNSGLKIITALWRLYGELTKPEGSVSLPDWTNEFLLPGETQILADIAETERRIADVEAEEEGHREKLRELRQYKALVGGYGPTLENIVKDALGTLGMIVEPGPPMRADFIGTWNGKTFVIEVQGVKKTAKEDHFRSLMMWVGEIGIERQVDPKGLLIVNAFRDTPPPNRTQSAWPSNVASKCLQHGFCALTGLQLLRLAFEAKAHPERKAELIQLLLDTNGTLVGFDAWSEGDLD
jgi:hypothetical protein